MQVPCTAGPNPRWPDHDHGHAHAAVQKSCQALAAVAPGLWLALMMRPPNNFRRLIRAEAAGVARIPSFATTTCTATQRLTYGGKHVEGFSLYAASTLLLTERRASISVRNVMSSFSSGGDCQHLLQAIASGDLADDLRRILVEIPAIATQGDGLPLHLVTEGGKQGLHPA